jgi:hypothetical protein
VKSHFHPGLGEAHCLQLQGKTRQDKPSQVARKKHAAKSYERSTNCYQISWRYIPEGSIKLQIFQEAKRANLCTTTEEVFEYTDMQCFKHLGCERQEVRRVMTISSGALAAVAM